MKALIAALEKRYGKQKPRVTDPFQQLLWENIAYLADDEARARAFAALKREAGLTPDDILRGGTKTLKRVTREGILPAHQTAKLLACARLAQQLGDLKALVRGPLPQARKALRKFPAIGAPGADRILLLSGAHPVFSLDSNGLRVLIRVFGYGSEDGPYDKTYRLVMDAISPALSKQMGWLQRASLVLRRHGQELCRRHSPQCGRCPVSRRCAFYKNTSAAAPRQKGSVVRPVALHP